MAVTWKKLAYEDDVVTKALFDAHSILIAVSDDTPVKLDVAASRIVGRASSGNIVALDKAGVLTIINVADGADVTGSNPPQAHHDLHDPQDGSDALDCAAPAEISVVVAASEGSAHEFARADHVHAISHAITDNHLVTVDGSPANTEIALWTADGLDGATPAAVAASMALDDIGVPDAAVDFDLQEATDLVVMTVANEAALPGANVAVGQLCWATAELTLHVCTVAA